MTQCITATLKGGKVLTTAFPDLPAAEAELRRIERYRAHRVGLREIYWETVEGEKWCLSVYDFAEPPVLLVPAGAV